MNGALDWDLILDSHQVSLIKTWQLRVETGEATVLVEALRDHHRLGVLALPLNRLTGANLTEALATAGCWAADARANALLAVWHDGQLFGALGLDCPWPGRMVVLRADPDEVVADYYPAVVTGAPPLVTVEWTLAGAIRSHTPALPTPMLELLYALRHGSRSLRHRTRLRRSLNRLGILPQTEMGPVAHVSVP